MATPASQLASVITFQSSGLDYLHNANVAVNTFNTKFKDFEKLTANLGNTVSFSSPVRTRAKAGLVVETADWQGIKQNLINLTVDQSAVVPIQFSDQDYLFNAENYIDEFHDASTYQFSGFVEKNVFETVIAPNTYRSYNAGITSNEINPITSYKQLAQAITNYKNVGAPSGRLKMYIPDVAVPEIIDSGLNQFVLKRNEDIANSWELGSWNNVDFYSSNLLPIHTAGTVGNTGGELTVVSISADGTSLTCTTGNGLTVVEDDLLRFTTVSGQADVKDLTWVGFHPSAQFMSTRVTSDATADGTGNIVVTVSPALISDVTSADQNVSTPIVAGMILTSQPSHTCGLLLGGDAAFIAMPRLPDYSPYASHAEYNKDTGVSYRVTYGSVIGQANQGFIVDGIWGATMDPLYAMRMQFPV